MTRKKVEPVVESTEEDIIPEITVSESEESLTILPIVEQQGDTMEAETVILISRLDHPCEISYNGDVFMLPAKGRSEVLNKALLGAVPKNVIIVANR